MSTSCLWTEDIRLKTNQFCPFAAMLVTEFCCDLQSVRANERSLVASVQSLGCAIWTGFTGACGSEHVGGQIKRACSNSRGG